MKFISRLKLPLLILMISGALACNAVTSIFKAPGASGPSSGPTGETATLQLPASDSSSPLNAQTVTPEPPVSDSSSTPSVENATQPTEGYDLSSGPYDENANPQKDIEAALSSARQDGKLVLLDFGANWCPDCVALSQLFEDPSVLPYLQEHYHVVRIDVGYWDKNLDISDQYGSPIDNGIPAVVVLTPNGDILATTQDGALANARTSTAADVLGYLKAWVAQKP